jgi:long-chain acyl-CoA synthetase
MSYEEAAAAVTAPGGRFEIETVDVDGVATKVFTHAPRSLREVFAGARARPDAIFLVYEDERWTFAEVMTHVDAMASLLVERYGVAKGDRVAIGMRNYPEWVISFAAITSIGAVSVSLNAWWTEDELDYALEDCGATVLIADVERVERASESAARLGCRVLAVRAPDDLPDDVDRWEDVRSLGDPMPEVVVDPDDDATILYTSGTTGHPKGAVSTHRAIVHALLGFGCKAALDKLRRAGGPEDAPEARPPSFILIVPLFHVTWCVPVMLSCFAPSAPGAPVCSTRVAICR